MTDAIIASVESRHVDAVAKSLYEAKIEDMEAADAIAVGSSTFDPVCVSSTRLPIKTLSASAWERTSPIKVKKG